MPASITRLSEITNPIAGLNPQGLPTHNMISPVAGARGETMERQREKHVQKGDSDEGKGEGERKGWKVASGDEKVNDPYQEVVKVK